MGRGGSIDVEGSEKGAMRKMDGWSSERETGERRKEKKKGITGKGGIGVESLEVVLDFSFIHVARFLSVSASLRCVDRMLRASVCELALALVCWLESQAH
eukprot:639418-Rhodomonas_salina.3